MFYFHFREAYGHQAQQRYGHMTNKKRYISISTRLVSTKLNKMVQSPMSFWSHGHMRSCDKKKKMLYFYFRVAYGHQAQQRDALWKWISTRNGHMTQSLYLYFYTAHDYRTQKVMALDIGPPRTKSHDSLITWKYVESW